MRIFFFDVIIKERSFPYTYKYVVYYHNDHCESKIIVEVLHHVCLSKVYKGTTLFTLGPR